MNGTGTGTPTRRIIGSAPLATGVPIGLNDVYVAVADWERVELATAPIPRADQILCFPTFPTADDLEPGDGTSLSLPFTSHWGMDTRWQIGSVRSGDAYVEDEATYTFASALFYALETDPLDAMSRRDADWRLWYRVGFLRHLQLGIVAAGYAHAVSMEMLDTVAFGRSLFNVQYVGIMSICTACIRQSMQTGLG